MTFQIFGNKFLTKVVFPCSCAYEKDSSEAERYFFIPLQLCDINIFQLILIILIL